DGLGVGRGLVRRNQGLHALLRHGPLTPRQAFGSTRSVPVSMRAKSPPEGARTVSTLPDSSRRAFQTSSPPVQGGRSTQNADRLAAFRAWTKAAGEPCWFVYSGESH